MSYSEIPTPTHDEFDAIQESLGWQMHVMHYCQAHYRQTAQIVAAKIIESDYRYGVDNYEFRYTENSTDKRDDTWVFYRRADERGTKEVYLTSAGLLRFDLREGREKYAKNQAYIPGVFDESPLEAASIYANLVGMVEDDAFREDHLAFLEKQPIT